jgi:hypothetical protein
MVNGITQYCRDKLLMLLCNASLVKNRLVIHPFLFAIFPILFLFSHNIRECYFSETVAPASAILGFTFLLTGLSALLIRNWEKAGILVSICVLLFFSYGHIYDAIASWRIAPFFIGRHIHLMSVWALFFTCATYILIRTRRGLHALTRILNIMAFYLVAVSLVNIGAYKFQYIFTTSGKPTGGDIAVVGNRTIHTFSSNGVFTSPKPGKVDYLVIGGGGGGGEAYTSGDSASAGGGAGGFRTGTEHPITARAYSIIVGNRGAPGYNGFDSVFDSITGSGGGGGGWSTSRDSYVGANGGSGGGGAGLGVPYAGGKGNMPAANPSQGTDGASSIDRYISGGGGGATAAASARQGGVGSPSSISGAFVTYAGGGSGGGSTNLPGGSGGGGVGGPNSTAGNDGKGAGGGGGYGVGNPDMGQSGKAGGKGIVIISYFTADFATNSTADDFFPAKISHKETNTEDIGKSAMFRDIYYIILDGYASSSTLTGVYGYDNRKFIDYLNKKGFRIASESLSNYATTYLSLASSLNMEYFDNMTDLIGSESNDRKIPNQMIRNSNAMNYLRSQGYKIIHFGSGWGATGSNGYADLDIQRDVWALGGDELMMVLIQTTMLRPFEKHLIENGFRGRLLFTFSELAKVYRIEGPKFIFAHITCPHPPYVFAATGESVPEIKLKMDGNIWEQKENYLNQLLFINKKVEMLVDEILLKSEPSPIIILQADHGSASTLGSEDSGRWNNPTEAGLKERMRIFNAYYLPPDSNYFLYDSITPVNTFRLVFNLYFNTNYKLLEDKSYYSTYKYPYKVIDVTNKVDYN